MGKYDAAGKQLITLYHQAWVEWLLQKQQIQVEDELSGDFEFLSRQTDSLLKVTGLSGEFLSLTELQFQYDPEMAVRLAAYKFLARRKYKLPVYVTVIFFLPPPKDETIPIAYHETFMGQTAYVDYRIIKLWELEATEVLRYNNPMLLPFVPLMKGGGSKEIVQQCVKRIRQEPEPTASELEAIFAIFASYVLDVETLKQILRWEMHVIEESPLIQDIKKVWFDEGLEKGRVEGLEKGRVEGLEKGRVEGLEKGRVEGLEVGRREAMIKALKLVLAIRFEVTADEFDDQFAKLTWDSLEELNEIALKVDNLEEFQAQLNKRLPPPANL